MQIPLFTMPAVLAMVLNHVALAQNPRLVDDIRSPTPGGARPRAPRDFVAVSGRYYFVAFEESTGQELYVTAGQRGTTERIDVMAGARERRARIRAI